MKTPRAFAPLLLCLLTLLCAPLARGQRPTPTPDETEEVEVLWGEESVYEGEWQTLASRAVRSDARATEAGGRLRLGLPRGLYTLRVTARDARSKKKATQTVDFEVVP